MRLYTLLIKLMVCLSPHLAAVSFIFSGGGCATAASEWSLPFHAEGGVTSAARDFSVPVRGGCAATVAAAARDWWSTGDRGGFAKTWRINIHPNNILGFWVQNLNTMGIFELVFLNVIIERAYSRRTRRVFVNIIETIE